MAEHSLLKALVLCLALLSDIGPAFAQNPETTHRQFANRLATAVEEGEMMGKPVDVFMREEKIALLEGNLSELKSLLGDTSVTMELTLVDGKRYALSFVRDGQRRMTLSYPADYQLIMGVTLMDMEDRLQDNIVHMPVPEASPVPVDPSRLQQMGNSPVYLKEGNSYVLPELNNNRYYVLEADSTFGLLYSEDMPVETMANLVTGTDIATDLDISILLVKYNYRTETFTVPLRQWVAYGIAEGCTPYYGVIRNEPEQMVCELVMHNESMGYAHVMKLTFNPAILGAAKGTVTSRLNSYVPLPNVKAIFNEK